MRDPERIDKVLEKIKQLWKQVPDWRLGQLIVNLNKHSGFGNDAFYIEDDKLIESIEEFLKTI